MLAKWDCGLGSYLLKEAFLLLYHIARNKDPFVKSICVSKMGLHVLFIRLIQDWDFKRLGLQELGFFLCSSLFY